jgi:hypothetical protein
VAINNGVDQDEIVELEYYTVAFPLLNDSDNDYFIRNHPELVVEGTLVWEKRASDDQTWVNDYQKWTNSIRDTIGHNTKDYIWAPNFYRYEP